MCLPVLVYQTVERAEEIRSLRTQVIDSSAENCTYILCKEQLVL